MAAHRSSRDSVYQPMGSDPKELTTKISDQTPVRQIADDKPEARGTDGQDRAAAGLKPRSPVTP
jgi:hypothetical protein